MNFLLFVCQACGEMFHSSMVRACPLCGGDACWVETEDYSRTHFNSFGLKRFTMVFA